MNEAGHPRLVMIVKTIYFGAEDSALPRTREPCVRFFILTTRYAGCLQEMLCISVKPQIETPSYYGEASASIVTHR